MTLRSCADLAAFLDADDPPPVEIVNGGSAAPTLLICDHAGRLVPRRLGRLGLDETEFDRHIAWDIGAADVARRLSARLNAPLVLSVYSRLVTDVNRRPDNPTAIAEESDGTLVPANRNLTAADKTARISALSEPYHAAIDARLDTIRHRGDVPMLLSIHSFTPVFQGFARPWQIGLLWNRDDRLVRPLMAALAASGITVGDNQPYSGQDGHGYTMPRHVEGAGIPHVLIEIRQNLIDTQHGAAEWAERLYTVLAPVVADGALRQAVRC